MESALTKQIKERVRYFKPALNSPMRTIRWAEEVQTPTGFVDVIRFEDHICKDLSYCSLITPFDNADLKKSKSKHRDCKIPGRIFPNELCKWCVYKRNRHDLDILATCYEIKISVSDFKSDHGHNFNGNRNYYVVPVDIYGKIQSLVPSGIGIIIFYPESGRMTVRRECKHREITAEDLSYLLYNALKKWVDGNKKN